MPTTFRYTATLAIEIHDAAPANPTAHNTPAWSAQPAVHQPHVTNSPVNSFSRPAARQGGPERTRSRAAASLSSLPPVPSSGVRLNSLFGNQGDLLPRERNGLFCPTLVELALLMHNTPVPASAASPFGIHREQTVPRPVPYFRLSVQSALHRPGRTTTRHLLVLFGSLIRDWLPSLVPKPSLALQRSIPSSL